MLYYGQKGREGRVKMRLHTFILLSALLLVSNLAKAQTPKIEVGQVFPNLTLPSLEDGRPTSLADFRGHKVILHIFASW